VGGSRTKSVFPTAARSATLVPMLGLTVRPHQRESRIRENRPFGSEGGVAVPPSLPLSELVVLFAAVFTASAAPVPDFSREVLPLLEQQCFKCHGPEKQKGGLRFDTKEGAFKTGESGEQSIVPGHANESRLIKLVSSSDDAERMPSKGEALSAMQIDLLKRWIDAGAEWPEAAASTGVVARSEMIVTDEDRKHWSYLPLTSPKPPAVRNTGSVRTAVDRFILGPLEE
jgi:mono/diheme cytochrome c family protein